MKERNKNSFKKNSFIKDFGWYFLGSFLPLLIGFIKTPIFTRHFDKESYGYLSLVTITFSYFGMLLFSWIGSCIWRYYNKYKNENNLKTLYSNLAFLFIVSLSVLCLITVLWYLLLGYYLTKQLILYSFLQLIFNQIFLYYMVVVRLEGKATYYTFFHSIRSFVGIITALILVFVFQKNIVALISSLALVDFLTVVFLVFVNPVKVSINIKLINRKALKELFTYGSAGLIINLGFLTIASSDRYIIAWLTNLENVGLYDQVYKISQLSVVGLVTVYFNTINTTLLSELESNFDDSIHLIKKYIKLMIIYGLPIIIYLSLFSKDIANILLGEEFRTGYAIMPFVFLAAYLHGILNFYELRLKFSNKLKKLSLIIFSAAFLNIILTYIYVDLYGYKLAAITTTVTYIVLVIMFHALDKKVLSIEKRDISILVKVLLALVIQISIYSILNANFTLELWLKIVIGLLFVISYSIIFKKQLIKVLNINEIINNGN